MLAFYNIGIRLYHFAVFVASFFNPKAKKWLDGRVGLLTRIEKETSGFSGETLWVHCASLGEFEMARPIIERLKESNSSLRVILTFFSSSGYEVTCACACVCVCEEEHEGEVHGEVVAEAEEEAPAAMDIPQNALPCVEIHHGAEHAGSLWASASACA